jgi:hypothetical protein
MGLFRLIFAMKVERLWDEKLEVANCSTLSDLPCGEFHGRDTHAGINIARYATDAHFGGCAGRGKIRYSSPIGSIRFSAGQVCEQIVSKE